MMNMFPDYVFKLEKRTPDEDDELGDIIVKINPLIFISPLSEIKDLKKGEETAIMAATLKTFCEELETTFIIKHVQ